MKKVRQEEQREAIGQGYPMGDAHLALQEDHSAAHSLLRLLNLLCTKLLIWAAQIGTRDDMDDANKPFGGERTKAMLNQPLTGVVDGSLCPMPI